METRRPHRHRPGRHRSVLPVILCLVLVVGAVLGLRLFGLWPGAHTPPPEPDTPSVRPDEPTGENTPPTVPDVTSKEGEPIDNPADLLPPAAVSDPDDHTSAPASEAPVSAPEVTPPASSEAPSQAPPAAASAGGDYAALYYYEADKATRYAAYHTLNPDLTDGEVVWQVNAGIDGTPYEDYEAARYTDTSYYIVSKHRKLPDSFEPTGLTDLGGYKATEAAASAYYAMQADAQKQGLSFWAISAYRSIDSQRRLYNGYLKNDPAHIVDTYSARAGFSDHHTGRAIDLCGSNGNYLNFENAPEGPWVHANAYKYGFILRYPKGYEHITGYQYEAWHMTYVGVDIATEMHNLGIATLEEYTVKYIDHRP